MFFFNFKTYHPYWETLYKTIAAKPTSYTTLSHSKASKGSDIIKTGETLRFDPCHPSYDAMAVTPLASNPIPVYRPTPKDGVARFEANSATLTNSPTTAYHHRRPTTTPADPTAGDTVSLAFFDRVAENAARRLSPEQGDKEDA